MDWALFEPELNNECIIGILCVWYLSVMNAERLNSVRELTKVMTQGLRTGLVAVKPNEFALPLSYQVQGTVSLGDEVL
jgi:hypothetical protein